MQTLLEIAAEFDLPPDDGRLRLLHVPDNQRGPMARLFRAVDEMLSPANDYESAYDELSAAAHGVERADEEPTQ